MSSYSDEISKGLYKLNGIKKLRKKTLECVKYLEDNKETFDKKTFVKYTKSEKAMINCTLHLELFTAKKLIYDSLGSILFDKDFITYFKNEDNDSYKDLLCYFEELKEWYKELKVNKKND